MIQKTKGIIIKSIKYGETSLVVTMYTEFFGMQSYIINGVRTSNKKGMGKANMFQPGSILDIIVYHNELKNLQRIKEFKWGFIYQSVFSNVIKNAVLLFCIELLQKTIREPESNSFLFEFIEASLIELDKAEAVVTANFPLFFSLQLMPFLGLKIQDNYSPQQNIFDLSEGGFKKEKPAHSNYLNEDLSFKTSELLKVMQPVELNQFAYNHQTRRMLLQAYQLFYALHLPDFGAIKSWHVLQEIL